MADKLAKADVQYGPGKRTERCYVCEHFIPAHGCELVAGRIQPDAWCNRFKRERGRALSAS
jgi:hypothetical protein